MGKKKIMDVVFYIVIFLLTLGVFIYDNLVIAKEANDKFTFDSYLKKPNKYGGKHKVEGSIKRHVLGESAAYLDFKKNGTIELIEYHNYNYNYILYAVSFVALLMFIALFFNEWKPTLRGFKNA
ncbi:hypothetical protein HYY71_00410 [Candidatus Woesearchaeota archaeon]|nr:hypothetical protein [Candidatus Woesearchaeota archaeon]